MEGAREEWKRRGGRQSENVRQKKKEVKTGQRHEETDGDTGRCRVSGVGMLKGRRKQRRRADEGG